jgi:hypothetical protein
MYFSYIFLLGFIFKMYMYVYIILRVLFAPDSLQIVLVNRFIVLDRSQLLITRILLVVDAILYFTKWALSAEPHKIEILVIYF